MKFIGTCLYLAVCFSCCVERTAGFSTPKTINNSIGSKFPQSSKSCTFRWKSEDNLRRNHRRSSIFERNALPFNMVLSAEQTLQGGLPIFSVAILLGYHIGLLRSEKSGIPTWRSCQAKTRMKWSKHVRETEGWLYAVQTLRNAITANTFLATTVLSLLTVISGKLWGLIRSFDALSGRKRLMLQFGSISLCMLISAYEFLQSARLMTHAGFMFPVVKGDKVDEIMRKSQISQWLGLRWLYISLGFILWAVAGEWGFLCATLGLVKFFKQIDKVPAGLDEKDLI